VTDHDRRLMEAAAEAGKGLAELEAIVAENDHDRGLQEAAAAIAAKVAELYPTEQELADQLADLERAIDELVDTR